MEFGNEGKFPNSLSIFQLKIFLVLSSISNKLNQLYLRPNHSKYNPIERVWGILEKHWNGEILDSVEKALGFAGSMTWNFLAPVINWVESVYETGVKLTIAFQIKILA